MRKQRLFSNFEILVVAVILCAAGIKVLPQLTEASNESKISTLVDGLEIMRAQLDLYRIEHENRLPVCDSFEDFESALTTGIDGRGPYLRKMPMNPFNNLNTVRFDGEPAGSGKAGWRLNTKAGVFQADNDVSYSKL